MPAASSNHRHRSSISGTLIITPGDPGGVGPEITCKALSALGDWLAHKRIAIRVIGAAAPFLEQGWSDIFGKVEFVNAPLRAPARGVHLGGFQSGWAIETSVKMILRDEAQALVTGPISKEHLQQGGFSFSGHTDFLAALTKSKSVTMMLANEDLRVSLATVHCSLRNASEQLSADRVFKSINDTVIGLKEYWGIKRPRIAVLGLNPHAGEGGLFGDEERTKIVPGITRSKRKWGAHVTISGPHPADTWFALNHRLTQTKRADAVLAMTHDQGLIPVKLIDFENTVNLSLGLPFLRTSVDHGTAFDIAGKNKADPSSMIAALKLAADYVIKKR
jgi:4-hydroxythreonine-4-phosphate dehydrogenase